MKKPSRVQRKRVEKKVLIRGHAAMCYLLCCVVPASFPNKHFCTIILYNFLKVETIWFPNGKQPYNNLMIINPSKNVCNPTMAFWGTLQIACSRPSEAVWQKWLKVRQLRNDFFKPTFTTCRLVFVRFLEESEDAKKTFRN